VTLPQAIPDPAWQALARHYPALAELPPAQLAQVRAQPVLEWPAGTRLFGEGDACPGAALLLAGEIEVYKRASDGRSLRVYQVRPGETCFATLQALSRGEAYRVAGQTTQATQAVVVPAGLFEQLLRASPAFARMMVVSLSDRLADLLSLVETTAFARVDARLAAALLGHGPTLAVTHQQLAEQLGVSREGVTRTLGDWAAQGIVRLGRGRIDIADPAALRRMAG
jgi:CRP/FNR family transcriptional regulator